MIATAIIATPIALVIHYVRRHLPQLGALWTEARWYEKAILLLALAPIPGPFDELVGLVVIRRIHSRTRT